MIIKTMSGLGDCIYLRPVLRELLHFMPSTRIQLITSWPQVFTDLVTKFIKPKEMYLRTQNDNINLFDKSFWQPWQEPQHILNYLGENCSITGSFCRQLLGCQPTVLDNSWLSTQVYNTTKPLCLIRPTTLRTEWFITTRGPKPEYLQRFVDQYRDKYYIVSIANIKKDQEYYEKKLEGCAEYIENTTFAETFALFSSASLIVCSVSFWVPMALALNKPAICIYGGHESPSKIVDSRIRRDNYKELVPPQFCNCHKRVHNCNKDIPLEVIDQLFKEQTCLTQ